MGVELGRVLVNPPSYMTTAQIRATSLDYDISSYTDGQVQDILNRASGKVDAIMRQSLLATEYIRRLYGTGSNVLSLGCRPIVAIRKMQFTQPGLSGFIIPLNRVLVDAIRGEVVIYSPLALQGVGYVSIFPLDLPIDVTFTKGYGYNPYVAPAFSFADAPAGQTNLTPGTYTVGVSLQTQWGTTLPTFHNITTATGSISLNVVTQMGAYLYQVWIAAGANQSASAMLCAEIPATTFGGEPAVTIINSLTPPSGYFPQAAPTADSSAIPLPNEITEAMRLLFLNGLYEQNSLANRGVQMTESGKKKVAWRSTSGSNDRGVPLMVQQAEDCLRGFRYQDIS
jgi:hypothetical protein